ncbi:MAG: DUF4198 domain-containing protein [Paracoccaceae bacterium]
MRVLPLLLMLLGTPASAHEFWIEPLVYQPDAKGRLEANLVNGQSFGGAPIAFLPSWFQRFVITAAGQEVEVSSRMGDLPAVAQAVLGDGLHVVVYQSTVDKVTYQDYAKFAKFAVHKDLGDVRTRHVARGLPEAGFAESYTRFSKSLVGVGTGVGADSRLGLETEIVALNNPYVDDLAAGMRVQLFYGDAVRSDAQVEVFEKAADGTVLVSTVRTDAEGVAVVPVRRGYAYMLDAVLLREPDAALAAARGVVWETLWANLTFAVPQ